MTDALSLSDLFARRVHLHWYEGVALVRGVTGQLLLQESTGWRIPELHQIALAADGSVAIAGGVRANEPVRRLGQLLQATLTDAEIPVQLRLIVSQATAPMPTYASVIEFDEALEYFERPDRAGLLMALFVRAQAAGRVTGGDVTVTLDRIAPLSEKKAIGVATYRRRKPSYRLIGIALAVVTAIALSSAAALYLRHTGVWIDDRTASRAAAAGDALGTAVLTGASAVSDSVGLGRIVPAAAADAALSPAAVSPPAPARAMKRHTPVAAAVEISGSDLESVPPRTLVEYELPDDAAGLTEVPERETGTPDPSADAPIDSLIYTIGAVGVSPPVSVGAQVPRQLPAGVDPGNLVRIELIVARDGSVESARLISPRRHVLGGMFLSAAKAWEFHPATKDGIAVRFRKTILVSFE